MAQSFPVPLTDSMAAAELQRDPGFVQGSSDPYEATWQTVQYMCRLVEDSLADGIVQRATQSAGVAIGASSHICADRIWSWVKRNLKFVHHSKLLAAWLNAPDELQLLIRPDVLLKMAEPKGDCAVYTTLVCAMLDCAGVAWEVVTVAVDPRQPGIFSHVYARAILETGQRIPLDASHGRYAGWEVPGEHVSAKQIWDMNGDPIEDVAPMRFQGLHGMPQYLYGGRDRQGLGQDDSGDDGDDGGDDGTSTPVFVPSGPSDTQLFGSVSDCAYGGTYPNCDPAPAAAGNCPSGQLYSSTLAECYTPTAPLTSGSSIPTSTGSNAGTIAEQISAALQGGANTAAKLLNPQPSTFTLTGSTLLLFGGIALGAIFLFDALGKGKH